MTCAEAERLIDAFRDGELDARTMRLAALHLARCAACARELDRQERLGELLRESLGVGEERAADDADSEWIRAGVIGGIVAEAPRGFRLAAAAVGIRGVLLGRGGSRVAGEDDGAAVEPWLRAQPRGPSGLGVAGGLIALAAALVVAVYFGAFGPEDESERVARESPPAAAVAVRVADRALPQPSAQIPAKAPQPRLVRAEGRPAQIESVHGFGRGEVQVWAEPRERAAVIWLGTAPPGARDLEVQR